jgi:hypothetical protein
MLVSEIHIAIPIVFNQVMFPHSNVVANVTSESYFVGFPKSRLVVYDLE